MPKHFYPAIFTEESNGYSVSFPDLDGCFTEGDTLEEAYQMAFDAIGLYADNNGVFSFPAASNPKEISVQPNEFVVLIEFDEEEYRKRHSNKLVKKTLTIPEWVNLAAEQRGINFSATLTKALIEKIG